MFLDIYLNIFEHIWTYMVEGTVLVVEGTVLVVEYTVLVVECTVLVVSAGMAL